MIMYIDVVTQIVFLVKGKQKMQLTKINATPSLSLPTSHTSSNMQSQDYWAFATSYTNPEPMPAIHSL